ncbi:Tc toxin subunit A [Pseudomonas agarici]|uniref:Tc toxin subunit A n=1 Tax=Pseudomonas agarici TaxID=46677 RepID=UPI0015A29843|nr:Tc toxin subunit A [Pseudomonas agarici]NWB89620.1 hypothetical protein [Pseudomonas agarici]
MDKLDLLLLNLVEDMPARGLREGRVDFATAMERLDIQSVFDIVRQPKALFSRKLASLSDVDGELVYDNALSYAVQIGREYREQQLSDGRAQHLSRRTGIRSLVDIGPSYSNLFKENWDEFCKVGAMAAVDSPVAYLRDLYHLVTTQLEDNVTGPDPTRKIRLDIRRPDLKDLLIDAQSTFTPIPMLMIVNEVVSKGIERYRADKADKDKPIHQLLAERRHPFLFPYNFAYHQCQLGLSGKKPTLGELNYRISPALPISQDADNAFGQRQTDACVAQCLLSGLGPEQQRLLTEPSLFTTFYYPCNEELNSRWTGPSICYLRPYIAGVYTSFLVPDGQANVVETVPSAAVVGLGGPVTRATLKLISGPSSYYISLDMISSRLRHSGRYAINQKHPSGAAPVFPYLQYNGQTVIDPPPFNSGLSATFDFVTVDATAATALKLACQSLTVVMADDYQLSTEEREFFHRCYGAQVLSVGDRSLAVMKTFMQQTELDAGQVEALLARRTRQPRASVNCPNSNLPSAGSVYGLPFPHPSHYGACYVNGLGSDQLDSSSAFATEQDIFDNAMDLEEVKEGAVSTWWLTKTSLNRFDRLQRMIRLQRWTDIPFAELDTLIVAAVRAEGEANLTLELNANTLRTLGVFRYFNRKSAIGAEEFAAFLHHICPYTSGDELPLFDRVFNSPALFDTPFVLDQKAFSATGATPDNLKTLYQLCAGLGLQATEASLLRLLQNTRDCVGPLRRSLDTVSSLYRQARIARMQGLAVEDSWALADLLGGNDYHRAMATGALRTSGEAPDILDVLMQMDWALNWLKDSQRSIGEVRRLLALDPHEFLSPQALLERLNRLAEEVKSALVSPEEVERLNLPAIDTAQQPIFWREHLQIQLLDLDGVVFDLPELSLGDETAALIARRLDEIFKVIKLSAEDKAQARQRLGELLLVAHDRQSRVIEGFVQESSDLPMAQAKGVTRWAGDSVQGLFNLMHGDPAYRWPLSELPVELASRLQHLLRHADALRQLGVSARALRLFLIKPKWLGAPDGRSHLSLASFYLLERYSQMIKTLGKPEAELLDYFMLTHPDSKGRIGKARKADWADQAAGTLAQLLDWNKHEIRILSMTLPEQRATSLADIDWLRRCQQACKDSGLTADTVLQATALNIASPAADWQAVGQAAMAAWR